MGIIHRITGYHGTSKNHGDQIVREQNIYPSTKKTEWLGNGIYFWAYHSDAVWWGKKESQKLQNAGYGPVVLFSTLAVEEERYLDLDDSAQYEKFCAEVDEFLRSADGLSFKSTFEARCYLSNYYAEVHGIDLLAYTFSKRNYSNSYFDQLNRRQYCVKNKEIIQSIEMEVDDYAV